MLSIRSIEEQVVAERSLYRRDISTGMDMSKQMEEMGVMTAVVAAIPPDITMREVAVEVVI